MIRDATHADIPAMVDMGQSFFAASGYGDVTEYDPASAACTFAMLIDSPDGVALIADDDGPVGTAAALVYPFFFNHSHRHGQELFWWVNPDARGVGAGLLRELEARAVSLGAKSLAVAAVATLRPEALAAFYRRAGFHPSDSSFVKAL
jgi:GNAT superfamily N-acetyltransferase